MLKRSLATAWVNPMIKIGAIAIGLTAVIGLQLPALQALKLSSNQRELTLLERDVEARRNQLSLLRGVPAFGFNNVMADFIFLQFLQYFGDTAARVRTSYELNPDYFDLILHHDPYFRDGYFFLTGSTSLYAGRPDRTVEIMNRELPHVQPFAPDRAYYIWRFKATDEFLFLGDAIAAQASLQTGADWADLYEDEDGDRFAAGSRELAQAIANNPNSRAVRISVWGMVLGNAFDAQTQRFAIEQIEALGGRVTADGRIFYTAEPEPSSATPDPAAAEEESATN